MKKILTFLFSFAATTSLLAQTDVTVTMDPSQAASVVRIAVPYPESIPKTCMEIILCGVWPVELECLCAYSP